MTDDDLVRELLKHAAWGEAFPRHLTPQTADLLRKAAARIEAQIPPCKWAEDYDGRWQTGCGKEFVFNDDGPEENHFKFCYYCGRPIG